jgi:signal transduction histidine kinase
MREAVSNLVDNAIKFTPPGGKVHVEAGLVDGLPRVVVSDTGCGVPPNERAKIFKRFYRGERRAAPAEGHGLGLIIAETIANMHGFRVTVEDNNPGSRFELSAAAKASLTLERKVGRKRRLADGVRGRRLDPN